MKNTDFGNFKIKNGITVTIKDTPNIRSYNENAIGKKLIINIAKAHLDDEGYLKEEWLHGSSCVYDQKNKYCINYSITDFIFEEDPNILSNPVKQNKKQKCDWSKF